MSDSDPPDGDEQHQQHQTRNGGGSLARLRNLLRLLRRPASRGPEAAMEALIAAADLDGEIRITPQERFLIGNILKVHERSAGDVMVPRVDILALDIDQPFSEVVKCMVEHGHSRVPVYRETLDDVIGFIHVKDVLAPVADRRPAKLERLLRKVLYVAPSLPILDLLVQMRQARTHIAVVVDEFGGIDGLVTIEDLIEEIVGEIEDEHDVPETPTLIERPDGSIIADARIPIDAVEEQHGISLRPEMRAVLERRALETLTQGHLSNHVIFHVFHTPAIAEHAPTNFGLRPATFRHLRDSGLSPATIAQRGGRTRAGAQTRIAQLLKARVQRAVSLEAMSRAQARALSAEQMANLPAFMSHTYRTPSQQVSFLCRPH